MTKKFDAKAIRQKAMASDDVIHSSVFVEQWDVEVPVKTLTGSDLKNVMRAGKDDEIRMMILAVLHGCVTPEGEKIFEETDLAVFESQKGIKEITVIAKKIFEISGLAEDSTVVAKKD